METEEKDGVHTVEHPSSASSADPKHTPGPWAVWSSLYDGFGAAVVSGHAPGAELKTIAEVREYRDALLLAAAPDLLALAQSVIAANSDFHIPSHLVRDAAIAIAKATQP